MGRMVAGMPVVDREIGCESHASSLRMTEAALKIFFRHRLEKANKSLMQTSNQNQRRLNRLPRVRQARPRSLVIRLDRWPILGQGELKADVAIGVAVGKMMHNLAHGPSAVAVRRIKLGIAESVHGGAQSLGQQTQSLDLPGA